MLGISRAMLGVMPFKRLMPAVGMQLDEGAREHPSAAEPTTRDDPRVGRVLWAVDAAARRTPWESKCLAQSLTAATLLRMRGQSALVYFGVRPASPSEGRPMTAHAWCVSGDRIVTGAGEHATHAVVAVYSTGGSAAPP